MLGFGTIGQFAIGEVGTGATAEAITIDKWFVAFSIPARSLLGAKPAAQQVNAFPEPFPFVSFGWFEELSIPAVRTRQGFPASNQQFGAQDTAVIPVSRMTPWFVGLSEPARKLRGLEAQRQQFGANDPTVIPVSKLSPWFSPFSEPPRFKIGTYPPRQQFEARPPQLRPNPGTSASMAAVETKDKFLGGVRVFLRVSSGEVGIIEMSFTGTEVGIIEMATNAGTSGIIESAAAPATGSPIAAVTTAHVSIRIV